MCLCVCIEDTHLSNKSENSNNKNEFTCMGATECTRGKRWVFLEAGNATSDNITIIKTLFHNLSHFLASTAY